MPMGWFMFSTASSPLVGKHRKDPLALEGALRASLRRAGAQLPDRLYFEVGREMAHALVKDFDRAEPEQRKAILTAFDATYRKLLTPEEAKRARELEEELRHLDPEYPQEQQSS